MDSDYYLLFFVREYQQILGVSYPEIFYVNLAIQLIISCLIITVQEQFRINGIPSSEKLTEAFTLSNCSLLKGSQTITLCYIIHMHLRL